MGVENTESGGMNFQSIWITEESREEKSDGLYPGVHLGASGRGRV